MSLQTASELIFKITGNISTVLHAQVATFDELQGRLRSVKIDVKITPAGEVRTTIVQVESEHNGRG